MIIDDFNIGGAARAVRESGRSAGFGLLPVDSGAVFNTIISTACGTWRVKMHVLQRMARETPKNNMQSPSGADYDFAAGVWRRAGRTLALDPGSQPATKKEDIETGEDVKGQ